MEIDTISSEIHKLAKSKGWWDSTIKIDGMNLEELYLLVNNYYCRIDACRQSSGAHEEYVSLKTANLLRILSGFMELIKISRQRNVPELLALVHSEISEALEAYRKRITDGPNNFGEELADAVIRVFDMAEGLGIDIEAEILRKHEYNKTREYRHGGKAA